MPTLIDLLSSLTFDTVWAFTCTTMVLFLIGCHVVPEPITRIQSMPWTFQLLNNLDLEFQTVTYTAYHQGNMAWMSHLTLPFEQVTWFMLLSAWLPVASMVVVIALSLQAVALREGPLKLILTGV